MMALFRVNFVMMVFFGMIQIESSYAQDPVAQAVKNANHLVDDIEENYGPLLLKQQTVGLDWPQLKKNFIDKVKMSTDSRAVYFEIVNLLNGLQDAHVSASIPSSYKIKFGVQFTSIGQDILANFVPKSIPSNCPLKAGDKLVSIGSVAIAKIISDLNEKENVGNARSTLALQAMRLSQWDEVSGLSRLGMSEGSGFSAEFEFESRDSGEKHTRFRCKLSGAKSGFAMVAVPYNPKLTDQQIEAAMESEIKRIIDIREGAAPVKKVDPAILEFNNILTLGDKEKLKSLYKIIDAENKLFDLSMPEAFFEKTADEVEHHEQFGLAASGKYWGLGQKEPVFKLPKDFDRIGGAFSNMLLIGTPFTKASGFFAGVFKSNGRRIGLLRVPSYMPKNASKFMLANMSIRYLIRQLNKKSDVLIIDQTHNPGGAVVLSDWLIRSLVGEFDDTKHLKFKVRPRDSWRSHFEDLILAMEDVARKESSARAGKKDVWFKNKYLASAKEQYLKVYKALSKGDFLSEPISVAPLSAYIADAIDSTFIKIHKRNQPTLKGHFLADLYPINAHKVVDRKVVYDLSKPVYMLIDELDFSGGDATPAALKDYGRVTLVGVNTAGAGGMVERFSMPGFLTLSYSLTTSLMVRPDGRTIENVGVQPDVAFEMTAADVADGYVNVLPRLLTTLGL